MRRFAILITSAVTVVSCAPEDHAKAESLRCAGERGRMRHKARSCADHDEAAEKPAEIAELKGNGPSHGVDHNGRDCGSADCACHRAEAPGP